MALLGLTFGVLGGATLFTSAHVIVLGAVAGLSVLSGAAATLLGRGRPERWLLTAVLFSSLAAGTAVTA